MAKLRKDNELLERVRLLIPKVEDAEQLYGLGVITNMYIDFPDRNNKELLEIYCDMIESVMELDALEEQDNLKRLFK